MNKTPDDKFPCAVCGEKFDTMDDLAEHARVVHAGVPPREEHRGEGEPEGPKTRGKTGGEVSDMTRGQSSGRATGGEVTHPGEDFVPVEDKDDQDDDERDQPRTSGTSAGGTTRPGSPPLKR